MNNNGTTPSCTVEDPCNILLVEDDQDQIVLFKAVIALDGKRAFRVIDVPTVEEALTLLGTRPFSVIILDLSVQDNQGRSTFLKFEGYINKVPIIVLASFSNTSLADELLSLGASDYVVKGDYLGRAIVNIIRRTISRHKNILEITLLCEHYKRQLDELEKIKETLGKDGQSIFVELKVIANNLQERASRMRAG